MNVNIFGSAAWLVLEFVGLPFVYIVLGFVLSEIPTDGPNQGVLVSLWFSDCEASVSFVRKSNGRAKSGGSGVLALLTCFSEIRGLRP